MFNRIDLALSEIDLYVRHCVEIKRIVLVHIIFVSMFMFKIFTFDHGRILLDFGHTPLKIILIMFLIVSIVNTTVRLYKVIPVTKCQVSFHIDNYPSPCHMLTCITKKPMDFDRTPKRSTSVWYTVFFLFLPCLENSYYIIIIVLLVLQQRNSLFCSKNLRNAPKRVVRSAAITHTI